MMHDAATRGFDVAAYKAFMIAKYEAQQQESSLLLERARTGSKTTPLPFRRMTTGWFKGKKKGKEKKTEKKKTERQD